jgi:hypothetical protein
LQEHISFDYLYFIDFAIIGETKYIICTDDSYENGYIHSIIELNGSESTVTSLKSTFISHGITDPEILSVQSDSDKLYIIGTHMQSLDKKVFILEKTGSQEINNISKDSLPASFYPEIQIKDGIAYILEGIMSKIKIIIDYMS